MEDEGPVCKRACGRRSSRRNVHSNSRNSGSTEAEHSVNSDRYFAGNQTGGTFGLSDFDKFNDSDLLLAELELENLESVGLPLTGFEKQKNVSSPPNINVSCSVDQKDCNNFTGNCDRLKLNSFNEPSKHQPEVKKLQNACKNHDQVCIQTSSTPKSRNHTGIKCEGSTKKPEEEERLLQSVMSGEHDLFDDDFPSSQIEASWLSESVHSARNLVCAGQDNLASALFKEHNVNQLKEPNVSLPTTTAKCSEEQRASSSVLMYKKVPVSTLVNEVSPNSIKYFSADFPQSYSSPDVCPPSMDKQHFSTDISPEMPPRCERSAIINTISLKDRVKLRLQQNAGSVTPKRVEDVEEMRKVAVAQARIDASQIRKEGTNVDIGPFFGLPAKVQQMLETNRGISKLYDWQIECLQLPAIKDRKNLIYTLPTSGGKTLVAEVLIMRELLCHKRDALFVLPFVSIVQEKVRTISEFATELGFIIEEYAGSKGRFPPIKRQQKKSLYIATIEKAHSLINSLIENERMKSLGLVVVDELHMIGEGGSRGSTLENMLLKLILSKSDTQVIGMSATLSNIKDLQVFLNAEVYFSDFRPVLLKEYVKIEDNIFSLNHEAVDEDSKLEHEKIVTFPYSPDVLKQDPDHLWGLVMEVIPQNSCLMFCPTKRNCENVAQLLSKLICKHQRHLLQVHKEKRRQLLKELQSAGEGKICPVLSLTVHCGIAYHHSGLTLDERRLIEDAYSEGTLCLLTCTSTLAAGVNLPAKRVILKSPYVGMSLMQYSQYKQMTGRAGRAGIDSSGESFLIVKTQDRMKVKEMLSGPKNYCHSSLAYNEGKGVRSLLLSAIGLKLVTSTESAFELLKRSLLQIHAPALNIDVMSMTKDSLEQLMQHGLVVQTKSTEEDNSNLAFTLQLSCLGKATFKGSVDHTYSSQLYKDLKAAEESLNLASHLHLLFLVTPYDTSTDIVPDWRIYFNELCKLSERELKAVEIIGVQESYVGLKAAGRSTRRKICELTVKRFYLTLMLWSLWNQKSVWQIADTFSVSRGFLQNLLSQSAAFASCVYHFCQELEEFWAFQDLLGNFIKRLAYCVTMELIPLMEIPGVRLARAKQLYAAGFSTLAVIAGTDETTLVRSIEHLSRRAAKQIISAAKNILEERTAALLEDVEALVSIPVASTV